MSKEYYIASKAAFNSKLVTLNGKPYLENTEADEIQDFLKKVYKKTELQYPKFYKMDNISKLGFITSELLLSALNIDDYDLNKVSVILTNSHATLATDEIFFNSLKSVPSPAVFVYTLSNIMIGEICIKNGFKGENTFFINKEYNPEFIFEQVNLLFENTEMQACIAGWVNVDFMVKDEYCALLYLIEKTKNKKNYITFSPENISEKAIIH